MDTTLGYKQIFRDFFIQEQAVECPGDPLLAPRPAQFSPPEQVSGYSHTPLSTIVGRSEHDRAYPSGQSTFDHSAQAFQVCWATMAIVSSWQMTYEKKAVP
mgnify:FL=1|jgi:hypothetical protein